LCKHLFLLNFLLQTPRSVTSLGFLTMFKSDFTD
jgi:hypothetical protein